MFPGETVLSGAPSHEIDPRVSEFLVLHTPAGWYIGTVFQHGEFCKNPDDPDCFFREGKCVMFPEPNTRETDYFETEEEAKAALEKYKETKDLPQQRT